LKLLDDLQHKNSIILPACLFVATILTRIPFTSKYLYNLDSVHFALALKHYDVTLQQPHPPGYFLYVMFGRIFNFFIQEPNSAFIAMSILFSALTVLLVYYLGREIFDSKSALISAGIAITSPNLWFHGEVALSYAVGAFFSAFIGLLCWKVYTGNKQFIWLLAIILAIAGGIRQNTPVFLMPLCLFSIRKIQIRTILAAACLATAVTLCWFIPMVQMSGGLNAYFEAFRLLESNTIAHNTIFNLGLPGLNFHWQVLFKFVACDIGAGIILLLFSSYLVIRNKKLATIDPGKLVFFALWILPSFLFFLLVFIHPAVPGYALIFLPPLLLLTARSVDIASERARHFYKRDSIVAIMIVLTLTNLFVFFCLKGPTSYLSLVEIDRNQATVIKHLNEFDPSKVVLLLSMSRIYNGLSHATYYLPEYTVYDPQTIKHAVSDKQKFWGGLHRQTILTDRIILPRGIEKFATLIFSDEAKVLGKLKSFQSEQLTPTIVLVSAPISEAGKVFPEMGKVQFQ
jgi:Protein O-mannosyl-transferase TMEM260-like